MKIGYLGPKGTFTESALNKYITKKNLPGIERVEATSIVDLFDLFINKTCDEIIVPIENSLEGSVNTTIDLLNKTEGVHLKEEIILPIQHYLFAKEPYKVSEITDVLSHPQALAQCADYLRHHLPNVRKNATTSTAQAAEMLDSVMFQENKKTAAIGNKDLGKIYNLHIIDQEINDQKSNQTRFMVIARSGTEPTGYDMTSVILSSIKDKPGGLVELLGEFSSRKINLTRIESRPTRHVLGEYLFFIDCEGHEKDAPVRDALAAIKQKASYFKKLGSFKRDTHA
jgi:prephenate dehydratase